MPVTELPEVRLEADRFYDRAEVAQLLNLDPRVVGDMIAAGEIPALKSKRTARVLGQALIDRAKGSAR